MQPSIITRLIDSRWFEKKLKSLFISWKPLWSSCLKGAFLFLRNSCNNFFLKSTILNAQKHNTRRCQRVKYSTFFRRAIVDIFTCRGDFWNSYFLLIWQFHNSNIAVIHKVYIKNFRRAVVNNYTASVIFGTAIFSKELLFRNTFNLKVLSGYCCNWE